MKQIRRITSLAASAALAFSLAIPQAFAAENDKAWQSADSMQVAADANAMQFDPDAMLDIDPDAIISDETFQDAFTAYGKTDAIFASAIQDAMKYQGMPYVWGGKYPWQGGFDCSGLVTWVYDEVFDLGIDGWVTNAEHIFLDWCNPVDAGQARPGDLVFWRGTYGSDIDYISHVGIYCGGNIVYAAGDPINFYKVDGIRNIAGQKALFFFGRFKGLDDDVTILDPAFSKLTDGAMMHRLFNPYSGEHFYTSNMSERDDLWKLGWHYEGIGWLAPSKGDCVFRLYNPYSGGHLYTASSQERDYLCTLGWIYEGVGWKSGGDIPIYRQFNPEATTSTHNYSSSDNEIRTLVSWGWRAEGIAWYGLM